MSDPERLLPLFPLGQVVLFPGMSLPLRIFEERYKVMIGACQVTDQVFGVLLIRSGSEVGRPAEPVRVGCLARMLRIDRTPDGELHIMTIGQERFRLRGSPRVTAEGYLIGQVQLLAEAGQNTVAPDLLASVVEEYGTYEASLLGARGETPRSRPELPRDPVALSYRVAAGLYVHPRERQYLLEIDDVAERLQRELAMLRRENRPSDMAIGPFSVN